MREVEVRMRAPRLEVHIAGGTLSHYRLSSSSRYHPLSFPSTMAAQCHTSLLPPPNTGFPM
ncbi:Hypothetical predicted protein, partial [Pelobates cultripes]